MRPRPDRIERLPEQYFTSLLARVAAVAAEEGEPLLDLGRGNPDVPPPAHVVEALVADCARGDGGGARVCAVRRPARAPRGDRGQIRGRVRRRARPAPRGRRRAGDEDGARRGRALHRRARRPDRASRPGLSGLQLGGRARRPPSASPLPLDDAGRPEWDALGGRCRPCSSTSTIRRTRPRRPRPTASSPRRSPSPSGRAPRCCTTSRMATSSSTGAAPRSFLAEPGAREVGVELFSLSKSYGMAGWRLGFVVGNAELVARVTWLQEHVRAGIFVGAAAGRDRRPRRARRRRWASGGRCTRRAATGSSPRSRRSTALRGDVLRLALAAGGPDLRDAADGGPGRARAGGGLRQPRAGSCAASRWPSRTRRWTQGSSGFGTHCPRSRVEPCSRSCCGGGTASTSSFGTTSRAGHGCSSACTPPGSAPRWAARA